LINNNIPFIQLNFVWEFLTLVVNYEDHSIIVWDLRNGQKLNKISFEGSINTHATNGEYITVA